MEAESDIASPSSKHMRAFFVFALFLKHHSPTIAHPDHHALANCSFPKHFVVAAHPNLHELAKAKTSFFANCFFPNYLAAISNPSRHELANHYLDATVNLRHLVE